MSAELDFNAPIMPLSWPKELQSTIAHAANQRCVKIDGDGVGNVNRRCVSSESMRIFMANWPRDILILFMVILALQIPRGLAQTPTQLTLTLIGQTGTQYVTPAGQTSELKMEILNFADSDIYLLEGDAYLDPNLNGTWQLVHSESLGNFHLAYLQSAIWTFSLTMPSKIQAANATNGMPQVDLLIKISYLASAGSQRAEQDVFLLGVPGATVQGLSELFWLSISVAIVLVVIVSIGTVYRLRKIRRKH